MLRILLILGMLNFIQLQAATIVVTNTDNSGSGSLRDAISKANYGDIIRFQSSLIANRSDTIELLTPITINKGLFIKGLYNDKDTLFISGGKLITIFKISMNSGASYFHSDFDSLVFIDGKGADYGGAINLNNEYLNADGILYIRNCVFRNNTAANGGAIGAYRNINTTNNAHVKIEITNSQFKYNKATNYGGAIAVYSRASTNNEPKVEITMTNSNMLYNSADLGGAIFALGDAYYIPNSGKAIISINYSTISNNTATTNGGGIYASSSDVYSDQYSKTSVKLSMSTISHNKATGSGGAFYLYSHDEMIITCDYSTVAYNTALNDGSAFWVKSSATKNVSTSIAGIYMRSGILAFNGGNVNYNNTTYMEAGLKKQFGSYGHCIFDLPKNQIPNFNGPTSDVYSATSGNLKLGSLAVNPKGTYTIIPDSGSIAINTGADYNFNDAQNRSIVGIRDVGAAESKYCAPEIITKTENICSGSTYKFKGENLSVSGKYYDTIPRIGACDSIIELNLVVNPMVNAEVTISGTPGNVIMTGTPVLFSSIPVNSGTTPVYQWFVNNISVGGNSSTYNTSSLPNNAEIYCTMVSNENCLSKSKDTSNSIVYVVHSNNDEPCNSIALTVKNTCLIDVFANHIATNTSSVGKHSCVSSAFGDIWFSFVAPPSGKVEISTYLGTMTDAVMSVYSGNCNSLVEIGCVNDNGTDKMPSGVVTGLTSGITYFVRVSRYLGINGHFGICIVDPSPASIKNNSMNDVSFYPNPIGKEGLFIELSSNYHTNIELKLCDISGKIWIDQKLTSGINKIQTNAMPVGVYFVKISNGITSDTYKIIKVE